MARVRCPDGHRKTAYLGRDAYGDDVYECYRCERLRSRASRSGSSSSAGLARDGAGDGRAAVPQAGTRQLRSRRR